MDVLMISGTVGAGKTSVAEALAETLGSRDKKACYLDVDALTRVYPAPETDPFNEIIALELLGKMVPIWVLKGVEVLILPRVVEDLEARARYENLFRRACPAQTLKSFRLCLIVASSEIRKERIRIREDHNPTSLAWHLKRTDELSAILEEAKLEVDLRVENNPPKTPLDLAEEIILKLNLTL